MPYVATINVPGYLPMDDDPPIFDTPQEAWEYLADERERGEDHLPIDPDHCESNATGGCTCDEYSDTWAKLHTLKLLTTTDAFVNHGLDADGTGTVYGSTPGYDGDHDLGLAYSVNVAEDEGA